jgi:dihydropteroate synthase
MKTCIIGKIKNRKIEIGGGAVTLMGIINTSPDSFYSGSYTPPNELYSHAMQMIADGAEILDIGGQSTAPNRARVDSATERDRILEVLHILSDMEVPISIDTCNPEVLKAVIRHDIDLINDVSGLSSPEYAEIAADSEVPIIAMAALRRPGDACTFEETVHALDTICARMEQYSIDNYILDPGVGHWTAERTAEADFELCRRFRELTCYKRPLLAAISRKSFLGESTNQPAQMRLSATLAMTAWLVSQGAAMVRAHDVAQNRDVIKMCAALHNQKSQDHVSQKSV